jgi:hypothetical protein
MYDHAKACMMQPEEMAKKFNEAEMLFVGDHSRISKRK